MCESKAKFEDFKSAEVWSAKVKQSLDKLKIPK